MSLSKNSVAVITGAASGIGRSLAVRLAEEKIAGIAICDVNEQGLNETAEMVEKLGVKVSVHIVDTSKLEQIERLKTEVLAKHSRATHLINNAGVGLMGTFEQISLEDFEWLMNINFWGVIYGCKVFLPVLHEQESAHIVNISSVFGLIAPPEQTAYCASKFAVRGFTKAAALELGPRKIRVNSIHPGGIVTPLSNPTNVPRDQYDKGFRIYAAQRAGDPHDIGAAAAYLASDDAAYCMGTELSVDGGLNAGHYYMSMPGAPSSG